MIRMAIETANWQNAFTWLQQNWSSADETWAEKKDDFVAQLWLSDPAHDPTVTEFLRRVDEELTTDEQRRNTLVNDSSRNAFFAVPVPAPPVHEAPSHEAPAHESPAAQAAAAIDDSAATHQGYSTDHEQAKRLHIAYWDAASQRYLYFNESTQEWGEQQVHASGDASLGEELPFASLSDEEIAALFSGKDAQPTFAEGVAKEEVAIHESAPLTVSGNITAG